jgi:hypothetical protein
VDLTVPPGGPSLGDRYVVAVGGLGAWTGHDGEIAEWDGLLWQFTLPDEGMTTYALDENLYYTYNGGWSNEHGVSTFLALTDTPAPGGYAGQAGKVAAVNAGETGLVFTSVGAGGAVTLEWDWSTNIVDSDPGSGVLKGNNATQGSITELYISDVTANGKDVSDGLTNLQSGSVLIITEESDTSRWLIFVTSGLGVDAGAYYKLPGTVTQSGNSVRNNQTQSVQVIPGGGSAYVHPNHSGDVTSVGDGAQTIVADAVTNAKAANMPTLTIKGNDTGGAADPKDLTVAEAKALLEIPVAGNGGGDIHLMWVAHNEIASAVYEKVGNFIYRGSTAVGPITSVKSLSLTDNAGKPTDIRVFDVTNSLVIAEITGITDIVLTLQDLGTISNVPTGEAIMEVQMRGLTGGKPTIEAMSVSF